MIHKKDVIDFFKKISMVSLFTISFAGCMSSEEEAYVEVANIVDQSNELNEIVVAKNSGKNVVYFEKRGAVKVTSAQSFAAIEDVAEFLKANERVYVVLTGHVDAVAANDHANYNVALDRAYQVANKLKGLKIDDAKLYLKATTKQDAAAGEKPWRVTIEYFVGEPKVGMCIKKFNSQASAGRNNDSKDIITQVSKNGTAEEKKASPTKKKRKVKSKKVKFAPKQNESEQDLI